MASIEDRQNITLADSKFTTNESIHVTSTELLTPDEDSQNTTTLLATKILGIIEQYGLNYERTGKWEGFETFLPIVVGQVSRGESIKMLLPGFPFKSPNTRDKVLDVLPDLGEELALKHVNGLCENIKAVYKHGAEMHITSDGLVYNDLLGVADETVWNFGEAVRQITVDNGLKNISFLRLWDLLGTPGTWSREHYLANSSNIRKELIDRFGDREFEADMANKSTSDMQMTHTKYLEFLKQDLLLNEKWLAQSSEEQAATISETAKAMMFRWKAFSAALASTSTEYVRLSIHDSGGKDKLSMAVIPQKERGALGATPWHSVLVAELDGSYRSVQRHTVDAGRYELIHRNGRPLFFRARSELFDWSPDGLSVTFEHMHPTGLLVQVESSTPASLASVPKKKLRALSHTFSPIVLRGFGGSDEGEFADVESEKFETASYTVLRQSEGAGRRTSFVSSRLALRYFPMDWPLSRLSSVRYVVKKSQSTEQPAAQPLIITHPVTQESCLRWPVDPSQVEIDSEDQSLISVVERVYRDQRVALNLQVQAGDVVVYDELSGEVY